MKKRVLFLCAGNSARSIMAEAIARLDRGERWEAASAGSEPKGVHPFSIKTLSEIGADTSTLKSKHVSKLAGQDFDLVVTLCESASEACPFFPGGGKDIHMAFDDPAAVQGSESEQLEVFRRVRDEIREKIIKLLDDNA